MRQRVSNADLALFVGTSYQGTAVGDLADDLMVARAEISELESVVQQLFGALEKLATDPGIVDIWPIPSRDEIVQAMRPHKSEIFEADEWRPLAEHVRGIVRACIKGAAFNALPGKGRLR